jgi:predicted anti-sigma-YlaC factor YlaD
MNCLECQAWLQRRLDGDAQASPWALDQHLAECASCRSLHASGDLLLKTLETWPAPAIPADFSQRLTARVIKDRLDRQRRMRLRFMVTAALAASILVIALAGYFLLPVPQSRHQPVARNKAKEAPSRVERPEARPDLARSAQDAREALASLSERWADQAKEHTQSLLAAASPANVKLPNIGMSLEPAAQSFQQAGEQAFAALQPMTTSARRAFDYFLSDLPALRTSR